MSRMKTCTVAYIAEHHNEILAQIAAAEDRTEPSVVRQAILSAERLPEIPSTGPYSIPRRIYLDSEIKARLAELAEQAGVSSAEAVRRLIEQLEYKAALLVQGQVKGGAR